MKYVVLSCYDIALGDVFMVLKCVGGKVSVRVNDAKNEETVFRSCDSFAYTVTFSQLST